MANSPLEDSSLGLQLMIILRVDCSELFLFCSATYGFRVSFLFQTDLLLSRGRQFSATLTLAHVLQYLLEEMILFYSNFIIQYILFYSSTNEVSSIEQKEQLLHVAMKQMQVVFCVPIFLRIYIFLMTFSLFHYFTLYASHNLYHNTAKNYNGYQVK